MHKGVILLVKGDDASDARANAEEFLEGYGDGRVWDWYVIGGRWSGTLNTLKNKFSIAARKFMAKKYGVAPKDLMLTNKNLEECKPDLQAIWEKIGGTGKNPYNRDQYADRTGEDDILPLKDCLPVVKKWYKDMAKEANKAWRKLVAARKEERAARKEGKDAFPSSGYYAGEYKDFVYDNFCFESNVFDVYNETNEISKAIDADNIGQYWAVMVDMHN